MTLEAEYYKPQIDLSHSFYLAIGKDYRLLVGLKQYSPDLKTADFYWFTFFTDEDVTTKGSDHWLMNTPPAERLAFIKKKMVDGDCNPDFLKIFDHQEVEQMIPTFQIRDVIPKVCPDGPVTLVGDAAHAMAFCKCAYISPMFLFAETMMLVRGEGANNAITDVLALTDDIQEAIETKQPLNSALRKYENEMVERAAKSVLDSRAAAVDYSSGFFENLKNRKRY